MSVPESAGYLGPSLGSEAALLGIGTQLLLTVAGGAPVGSADQPLVFVAERVRRSLEGWGGSAVRPGIQIAVRACAARPLGCMGAVPSSRLAIVANTLMMDSTNSQEFSALQTVISVLQDLDTDARQRIFESAATFLQIELREPVSEPSASGRRAAPPQSESRPAGYPSFSEDTDMSPKAFLFQKQPSTDVERIAALAFYLAHYRDTPQFKTLDLSKLNTEAAQPKFSNAASSANNAVKQGYLVPTTKGQRQLSAAGERFVMALPDREAAREAMSSARKKRSKRPKKQASG